VSTTVVVVFSCRLNLVVYITAVVYSLWRWWVNQVYYAGRYSQIAVQHFQR